MRCHYLSDLHLEAQSFEANVPPGDVLIIAGDLCQANCLEPARTDLYSVRQRERVFRFVERVLAGFARVLLVPGNHEHYEGVFEDTAEMLRRRLPGVDVLDNDMVDIGGVGFFGSTLWTDFDGGNPGCLDAVRRRMGEYFFVKTRGDTREGLARFVPEDALNAHLKARRALQRAMNEAGRRPLVVVTHHAPSRLGLNLRHSGNGLDAAYASDLDEFIETLEIVPVWVHGHTHIAGAYRVGRTRVLSNAMGFAAKGQGAPGFRCDAFFDL